MCKQRARAVCRLAYMCATLSIQQAAAIAAALSLARYFAAVQTVAFARLRSQRALDWIQMAAPQKKHCSERTFSALQSALGACETKARQ